MAQDLGDIRNIAYATIKCYNIANAIISGDDNMNKAMEFLDNMNIKYLRYDHAPVKSSMQLTAMLPEDLPGIRTKNLLLRDRRKKNYLFVVIDENKAVDYKKLSEEMSLAGLGTASPEDLMKYYNAEVGALSLLSLLYIDENENKPRFIIDEDIWEAEAFDCCPNINGICLLIFREDWMRIFNELGIQPEIVKIPSKNSEV